MNNPTRHRMFSTIAVVAIAIAWVVSLGVAYVLGAIRGETGIYQNIAEIKIEEIEKIRKTYPNKFSDLVVEKSSAGFVGLYGTVSNQEDRDILVLNLRSRLGNDVAEEIATYVTLDAPK